MKNRIKEIVKKFKTYIKKLLFPLYLFPIKLLTYSTYYFLKFVWKIISWPFRKWSNFFKTILWTFITTYILLSLLVIIDYLGREYGNFDKILCGADVKEKLKTSVVRIIGGYGEGSGFFISPTEVVTNFHVIANEPSPKVVFPDGHFETPVKIVGDKNMDIAVLTLKNSYPDFVYDLPNEFSLISNEPLLSAGYPLGSEITGDVTIVKGNFIDFRKSSLNNLTDQEIKKINVDPTKSPEDAVFAFYTYLKARQMEKGYNLLSSKYLEKTNSTEWTNRFTDILDVDVISTEKFENTDDTVFVKFGTTNWVDGEAEYHFYEGTWETVIEEGIYKMNKSKIKEVDDPDYNWFYE
ncbi:hypothetical protein A2130_02880 [Candidatus Woesebacteria bacterium GWC2_33_12]|uniref:Serine protease n=1 Tax=Candidatus Woesebacteria bacterium GW2011_GWB1_33_22 TaxID=1618566 RepID=A0A0G0C233_9BACT|nr:MAG: hypothetical protein UR29_C0009G0013 [Candidatus Woesebacteria bacterium GW2011_GWC2_33_12]KKP45180.1 MAG: hypothetical protein UR35_C0002G0013 [Candidatus Woesebacteria bacterium GW2011_GWB1_33_22]KKP46179.1 MAG: Periplasmic serine protease, Do/DeqQ family [Microgenomates group bacterium GW2011_GWC1_33_28]OGM07608.1 MAG: hypothetical protein A2130_02880 [Candidatus Woesebacteria bacterium GWC2_33_12]OGM79190.1 MAG: hypothetical protein A2366_00785 [Candidatus Woesebacteria bacterium RI